MDEDQVSAILAGWREAEQAATEGPWGTDENHGRGYDDEGWSRCFILGALDSATPPAVAVMYFTDIIEPDNAEADAAFIVTARTAMPLLLAAVEVALEMADGLAEGQFCAGDFCEAITAALTGAQPTDPPQSEEDRRAAAEALEALRTRLAGKGDGDGS